MPRVLSSIRPLLSIILTAIGYLPIQAIRQHHGSTLQYLRISRFIFPRSRIAQLPEYCPTLQGLAIEVLRTTGDEEEVQMYQDLGSISQLRKLQMDLQHTSNRHPNDPDGKPPRYFIQPPYDENEEQERQTASSIHKVFTDAAICEGLARTIFSILLVNQIPYHKPFYSTCTNLTFFFASRPPTHPPAKISRHPSNTSHYTWVARTSSTGKPCRATSKTSSAGLGGGRSASAIREIPSTIGRSSKN